MTTTEQDGPCAVAGGSRRADSAPRATGAAHTDREWVRRLSSVGPEFDEAVADLHVLMVKAARHQIGRMPEAGANLQGVFLDDLVQQAATEATLSVLRKLPTFEGRSRFTTWAYKFAILQTATEVRRSLWRRHDLDLAAAAEPSSTEPSPTQLAEASDLSRAVRRAMDSELTRHQRTVAVALLIDEVPIDVLSERMGTTRNALYKTLHDARSRLRRHLRAAGYLTDSTPVGRRA
ncbi:RNA polymerase sigma factor [Gordonia sp. (in: high G+C Gram-positive bacteria)]|uniref:RNA polymerase sigma factor n=1 Tax=Gordonia sp. (in: high G+C Gram-positive bacteria) TaxID=84139 RepID=UPI003C73324B